MINDFIRQQKKVTGPRRHAVKNSIGLRDVYKYIKEHNWCNLERPITRKEFHNIIRGVNKLFGENIKKSKEAKLPHMMGTLEVRKVKKKVWFKDSKLCTNLPTDWNATLRLWYEDQEARNNKTLVKSDLPNIFWVRYNKEHALYINQEFYEFKINRELKKAVARNASLGIIDAYILHNYDKEY